MTKHPVHAVEIRRFEPGCMFQIVSANLDAMGLSYKIKLTAFAPQYVVNGKLLRFKGLIALVDKWRKAKGMPPLSSISPEPKK